MTIYNSKYIYPFGGSAPKPTVDPSKQIVGGKGLGLQVMSKIGVDVPPGFTLTTPLCQVYAKENDLPAEVWKGVRENVRRIEIDMEEEFGASENPLLFSCRSGAASKCCCQGRVRFHATSYATKPCF